MILQQTIEPAQLAKILGEGKSDLLEDFVSARTRRKFKAFLVLDKKTGKIGFEFQPRVSVEGEKTTTKPAARTVRAKKAGS